MVVLLFCRCPTAEKLSLNLWHSSSCLYFLFGFTSGFPTIQGKAKNPLSFLNFPLSACWEMLVHLRLCILCCFCLKFCMIVNGFHVWEYAGWIDFFWPVKLLLFRRIWSCFLARFWNVVHVSVSSKLSGFWIKRDRIWYWPSLNSLQMIMAICCTPVDLWFSTQMFLASLSSLFHTHRHIFKQHCCQLEFPILKLFSDPFGISFFFSKRYPLNNVATFFNEHYLFFVLDSPSLPLSLSSTEMETLYWCIA